MTDQATSQEPDQQSDDPAGLRKLAKERADEIAKLREENDALKRDKAFDEAGVPRDGAAKYFRKGYDGDLTAEAIRAQAEADGLIQPPPDPPPDTPVEEQQAHGAIDEVTATPPPVPKGFMEQAAAVAAQGPEALDAFMESQGLSSPQ